MFAAIGKQQLFFASAFSKYGVIHRRGISSLSFSSTPNWNQKSVVVIGSKESLASPNLFPRDSKTIDEETLNKIVSELKPSNDLKGAFASQWIKSADSFQNLTIGAISTQATRHNSSSRPDQLAQMLREIPKEDEMSIVINLAKAEDAVAAAVATARAFPLYSTKNGDKERKIQMTFLVNEGEVDLERVSSVVEGVRQAARLVDMPAGELNVSQFIQEAETLARELNVECQVLRGKDLEDLGMGGLLGVGKAAADPPALVTLSYTPEASSPLKTFTAVGKGIVFDTGGLSIKGSANMVGMKRDMAGAAAVLEAFATAVRLKIPMNFHAVLCLAENSVSAASIRPDDILTLASGKTVEVNNTDAEGRLVLADGLVYALKKYEPDYILNIATLTGAQGVATGRRHAAIVSNDDTFEAVAVRAGRASGDLVHPLVFCPEFFRAELESQLADMKNSVKSRNNAPSSGAAQFLYNHMTSVTGDSHVPWLHVDMAAPSYHSERATGYGVGLILEILRELSRNAN